MSLVTEFAGQVKQLINNTPIEVGIGALVLCTAFSGVAYHTQSEKEGQIPTAFSEIEQIVREYEAEGQTVPPLTKFYASTNDVVMKVFESSNEALRRSPDHTAFAEELRPRIDANYKTHKMISDYAAEVDETADNAILALQKITDLEAVMPAINSEFSQAWTASHIDTTHTKTWQSKTCTGKGKDKTCSYTTKSKTIYDYTTHTYKYFKDHGENAALALNAFVQSHPDLTIEEHLRTASKTGSDNEEAIERSMKELFKDRLPSPAELLGFSNMWASGSTLSKYSSQITSDYASVNSLSTSWNAAKETAANSKFKNRSHSDDGPEEYRIATAAKEKTAAINAAAHQITDGILYAKENIPLLDKKIKDYVDIVLNKKEGDADTLRQDIMDTSRNIYKHNFENGFDVEPFKWSAVLLYGLLGLTLGAAAGTGVDYSINRYNEKKIRLQKTDYRF